MLHPRLPLPLAVPEIQAFAPPRQQSSAPKVPVAWLYEVRSIMECALSTPPPFGSFAKLNGFRGIRNRDPARHINL
jgi:hypothetical protein